MRSAAVLAGCVFCGATPALADAPAIKVAIIPGVAVNLDPARVDALSQDLATALEAELIVTAIGGLEVRRQLPPDLPPDCVATPTCVSDVAKRTGANQLLFVVMVDTGGNGAVQIDSTWVDPVTLKSSSRPAIDVAVISEAKTKFQAAATQLLPDAPVRPKPKTGIGGTMTKEVPKHFTVKSYATAGLGIVGLGVGIAFSVRTRGLYKDCEEQMVPCSDSQKDKIRTNALIADIGYLAALGGAVATAILYATSGSESRLVVSPNAEGGGGVTYVGRF
jgi:hypothetical protein